MRHERPLRPQIVHGGHDDAPDDPDARVTAVLEVLSGDSVAEVARRWAVDAPLLHGWVRAFVEAGTAQVSCETCGWRGSLQPSPVSLRLEVRSVGVWVDLRVVREADPIDPQVLRALFEPTFMPACGDVMPGCTARFESNDRDQLLVQVAAHAASAHPSTELTPEVLQAVGNRIVAA